MAKKAKGESKAPSTRLEEVLEKFNKLSGNAGRVILLGENSYIEDIPVIPSGILSLDHILGVGGYPQGRIVELYGNESSGKTTVTLHALASCQVNGGIGAFVDAEHALDIRYAKGLGVDTEKLLISQPDSGEEALNAVEHLAKLLGHGDMIAVDSVAALVPQKELDGEMGDSHMGLHARLMSQALRKITGVVSKTGVSVIFINQTRMKIGVMFGCLHYDTLVNFEDRKSIPIGEVVEKKIQGNVYCWNEISNTIEVKPIIDWHDNGKVSLSKDLIHIQTQSIDGRGRFGVTCTPNHKIKTVEGWKEAFSLSEQDRLISRYTETLNGTYRQFIQGCLIGDSHVQIRFKNTACLRFQDNENLEYVNWKITKLSPFINFKKLVINRGVAYVSEFSYEFSRLKESLGNRDPMFMLNDYSDLGMAVWIMDDGHLDLANSHCRYMLSIKRFKKDSAKLEQIVNRLSVLGFNCSFNLKNGSIIFNRDSTELIASKIAKYIPECMQYKLLEEFKGQYQDFHLQNQSRVVSEPVMIKQIRNASSRQMRKKRKFDLSIQDNHNYMVGGLNNGIIVHNSPETTTGGNALKFYATLRIEVRRSGIIKQGEDPIGCHINFKIVKNKVAPPFREAKPEMRFGQGVPLALECLNLGVQHGLVEKKGAWYYFNDQTLGQGTENAYQAIKSSPETLEYIETELRKRLKLKV